MDRNNTDVKVWEHPRIDLEKPQSYDDIKNFVIREGVWTSKAIITVFIFLLTVICALIGYYTVTHSWRLLLVTVTVFAAYFISIAAIYRYKVIP